MERFARLAAQAISQVTPAPVSPTDLESPPDPKLGDFGFPCFRLSKELRKGPPQVAQQLVAELKAKGAVPPGLEVAAVGPYVNFTVPSREVARAILPDILAGPGLGGYASLPAETRGTWVLEYSSPNVAKPFQFYHLRPTTLGAALDRIGRYRGFKVVSINHLGDWGTQYGKLAVALKMFGSELPPEPSIKDLVDIYVKFHAEAEKRPELEDEARAAFKKLEQNDPEMTAMWKRCVDISLKEFHRIYARIGVKFDHIWGESFYTKHMPEVLEALRSRGLLVESEGAQVVHVTDRDGKELPPCILLKSDGATIYATRDVAAAIYRYGQFKFDRMTYIVGGEQKLHFQQVFGVLRKLEMEWEPRCEHVPTGLYRFNEAKMSTRKGNYFTLEDVIDRARERVETLMRERAKAQDTPLPPGLEDIVERVAVGAVTFHDLASDPARNVDFALERIVDFDGETGPYLQYAHTRCVSIIRKAQETGAWPKDPASIDFSLIQAPEELALVKLLGQFSLHLERTLRFAKASQLATYLIDVTKVYGVFYRECRVLGDDPALTRARLLLVEATRRILARGMELLGIPRPERM
jgi:arginyl-tRNA synthetase